LRVGRRQTRRASGRTPGAPSGEPLGGYLRRHREAKGITIEELAATTKIKGRIIVAIEEDRYDDTPPVPVVRGFLKTLASEFGLRPAEVLARFDEMGVRGEVERIFPDWSAELKAPRRSFRSLVPAVAVFFLVVGIVFLFFTDGWNLRRDKSDQVQVEETQVPAGPEVSEPETGGGEGGGEKDLATEEGTAPAPAPASEGPGGPDTAARKVGPPDSEGVRTASVDGPRTGGSGPLASSSVELSVKKSDKSDVKSLVLKITAKEDTWLRVVVDGTRRDEIFLLEGDSRRWEGQKTFVLTVGNASSTLVELNGLTIQLPRTKSNLVRDFLISKNNLP
ncbi:MAG: helix-turn-helix domain-containing protein, partial [Nitrospinota bacterium]